MYYIIRNCDNCDKLFVVEGMTIDPILYHDSKNGVGRFIGDMEGFLNYGSPTCKRCLGKTSPRKPKSTKAVSTKKGSNKR